ncbi:hypothetical protein AXF42_Ash002858 [Apostasia shenzhenica]|uniref:NEDD8 ultimate buster 1 n=1 Tax=Apostasia shenzhenica TaxID=1088818 RepID=A0A2I0A7G7_9ASPA|nr:hypothetical protein AXF42_Ash002858 [Apostasia shenzhenica]
MSAAKLKIAGAWTGLLEVHLESWTLPMLREEVARRSGGSPDCINLICGGKILRDEGGSLSLHHLGLRNNSKVLASAASPDRGKALKDEEAAQAERSRKLSRIRQVTLFCFVSPNALAQRHAHGSFPMEDFNLELENQSGQKVNFGSENDQRYLRLELLEGVAAYYSGNIEESRRALSLAKSKFDQLQVPDEALSLLMSMGYKEREAKRALRMNAQDIQSAVDFLVEERAKKAQRRQENIQRKNEIILHSSGVQLLYMTVIFERFLAAEALRVNENDAQKALDLLTDPEKNCSLQQKLDSRKRTREQRQAAALPTTHAMNDAPSTNMENGRGDLDGNASLRSRNAAASDVSGDSPTNMENDTGDLDGNSSRSRNPTASNSGGVPASDLMDGSSSSAFGGDDRDEEMEDELAKELRGDAFADYDLEVSKEGEAIAEYLALLESATCSTRDQGYREGAMPSTPASLWPARQKKSREWG